MRLSSLAVCLRQSECKHKVNPQTTADNFWRLARLGGFMNIIGLRGACHHVVRKHGVDPNSVDPWSVG